MDLPAGARVGTGSIRRVVQLKALRTDLEYVPIRGNIQTRLGKLAELDAVVLAAAGLKRMGLDDQVTEYFSTEQMLPASGQGILAIETLCSPSDELADQLARVNDAESYAIAVAEMAYLKALNAGCQFPVASFAEFSDAGTLALRGPRAKNPRTVAVSIISAMPPKSNCLITKKFQPNRLELLIRSLSDYGQRLMVLSGVPSSSVSTLNVVDTPSYNGPIGSDHSV